MKICPNFNLFKIQKLNNSKQHNNIFSTNLINSSTTTDLNLQNTNYPVFSGGYSVNLNETYNHLFESDYPCGIKTNIKEALKNPSNSKTLYDIHFEKYRGINDCYSLEELKEKYPEFSDVISAYKVEAKDKSVIASWQDGASTLFSSDEDLTLQLIKLYWGQGFSLRDLSNYAKNLLGNEKGLNFYPILAKLNIPTMSVRYGKVLKLSNKEYNDKFTQALSQKLKETREEKQQELEGEPVFIPSGSLPISRKKHILGNIINHFVENPDTVYNMTKRQKEFYQNNPDEKEVLSYVLDFAWNETHEGKLIKKQLSKFAKKYSKSLSDRELTSPESISKENNSMLKQFWQINTWAKEKFSTAMKKGWDFAKTLDFIRPENIDGINVATINCLPDKIINEIIQIAKQQGEDLSKNRVGTAFIGSRNSLKQKDKISFIMRKTQKYVNLYLKLHPKEENKTATALYFSIYQIYNDLDKNSKNLPPEIKKDDETRLKLQALILSINHEMQIFKENGTKLEAQSGTKMNSITTFLYSFIRNCLDENIINANIISDYFSKIYNEKYNSLDESLFH